METDRKSNTMEFSDCFLRAAAALPAEVRRRMDGTAPLDWTTLEAAGTAAELREAIGAYRRLPEPVEGLVQCLILEVGIVPADLAAGVERQRLAVAWTHGAAVDPEGESYRLRDHLTGEFHSGIRPEAVAGYAVLALELAAAVHHACTLWTRSGEPGRADGSDLNRLGGWAARMAERLRSAVDTRAEDFTTRQAACALDDAWNAQSLAERAERAAIPLRLAHDARAPRFCHFAPMRSYRLHAYDLGEIRWLCALAEQAAHRASAETQVHVTAHEAASDEAVSASTRTARTRPDEPSATRSVSSHHPGSGKRSTDDGGSKAIPPTPVPAGTTAFDPDPDDLAIGRELGDLGRSATPFDPDPDDLAIGKELGDLGRSATPSGPDPDDLAAGKELDSLRHLANASRQATADTEPEDPTAANIATLEAQIHADTASAFELGSDPRELTLDEELTRLERAATQLPDPVRRRLGDTYGIGVTQALERLQNLASADAVRAEVRAADSGGRAPAWLGDLAAAILRDGGAQTRSGLRTPPLHLGSEEESGSGYRATDLETGGHGQLTVIGLVEQMHLGLTFACNAWTGLTLLRSAGLEGSWTLQQREAASNGFVAGDREVLEAARQINLALDRIERPHAAAKRNSTSRVQASIAARALLAVGPNTRTTAGWPGHAAVPDPQNASDVAQISAMAEALRGRVRVTSNRLISGQVGNLSTQAAGQEAG